MTSLTPPVIDAPALLRSALTRTVSVSDLTAWLSVAAAATRNRITMRPLDQLDSWSISPLTGDITHRTGRFFSITGVRVEGEDSLDQPIIDQPDVGVLGLLGQVRDGVLHMLIQAKVEPGNRRLAQISPTVQATSSNFERVHGGSATPFLNTFLPRKGSSAQHEQSGLSATLLLDVEQSEQSTRFLGKRNRNSFAVIDRAPPEVDESRFRWVTIGDLVASIHGTDLLHMDTRSVLGSLVAIADHDGIVRGQIGHGGASLLLGSRSADLDAGESKFSDLERWISNARQQQHPSVTRIPLKQVSGWVFSDGVLRPQNQQVDCAQFDVVGVRTEAGSREVTAWDQPLIRNHPGRESLLALQIRRGILHLLVSARSEVGTAGGVEIAPTLLRDSELSMLRRSDPCTENWVEDALQNGRTLLDVDLPEEGGRFLHSDTRHRLVLVPEGTERAPHHSLAWMTLAQLGQFLRVPQLCSIELRSLIACCSPTLPWED